MYCHVIPLSDGMRGSVHIPVPHIASYGYHSGYHSGDTHSFNPNLSHKYNCLSPSWAILKFKQFSAIAINIPSCSLLKSCEQGCAAMWCVSLYTIIVCIIVCRRAKLCQIQGGGGCRGPDKI